MPLLTAKSLQLAYGTQPLLDKADIAIDPQERIALIGRNGEGKSSFLKIIGGLMPPDDGEIAREQGLHAQYVTQEPQFESAQTVQQALAQTIQQAIEQGRSSEDVWTVEARAHSLVSKLGLALDQAVGRLSGGEVKRMQLLVALAFNPQLLLLDEPTNHLDLDGIAWLEQTLLSFRGAVMMVSHDRMFLDRVCTRIVELDRGRLTSFPGSYAKYQEIKARMLSDEAVVNAKFDKFLAQEEVWIRKGVEARRTRNEGRVRRLLDLRKTREARRERKGDVKLTIAEGERTGKLVAELRELSYNIGERAIIRSFSAVISRGDKLGILGRNGVGKTTLVKLILGELKATDGVIL
jgi:ABC transport system ATP-binding/permease protein